MNEPNRLIYPTIDLFLYDLAEGLGQAKEEIDTNRQQFWQKVYGKDLNQQLLKTLEQAEAESTDYIELLVPQLVKEFDPPLDGYYYPLKLGDTYALQVDCSGEKTPQPISSLQEIKEIINERTHHQTGTISQSWLVWGQLASDSQDFEKTAQECYKNLKLAPTSKWNKDFRGEGTFLGANFYELWQLPPDRGNLNQAYHVLICLFPYNQGQPIHEAGKEIKTLYPALIQLFRFRNKVIWAYHQSRSLKADMKQASQLIQTIVSLLPEQVSQPKLDLKKLQRDLADALTIFSSYANYLSRLEEQQNTIHSNLKNYQKRLKTIAKLDRQSNPDTALDFLESFSDFASEKYLPQVESDRASLSAGLRLLENAIKTIEGIIEIEQTKSDRALNTTIALASAGLATSGIAASIISTQVKSPENPSNTIEPYPAFWGSLGIGLISVVIAFLCLTIYRRFRRRS